MSGCDKELMKDLRNLIMELTCFQNELATLRAFTITIHGEENKCNACELINDIQTIKSKIAEIKIQLKKRVLIVQ